MDNKIEKIDVNEDTIELPVKVIQQEIKKDEKPISEDKFYGNVYNSVTVKDFDNVWDQSDLYHNGEVEDFNSIVSTDKIPVAEINKKINENNYIIKNMKCVYDVNINAWKIYCNLNGKDISKIYTIDKDIINNLLNSEKDLSLLNALEQFDKDMNTDVKNKYFLGELNADIIYDLRGIFTLQKEMFNKKQKDIVMKNAKKQKKKGASVFYFNSKKSKDLLSRTISEKTKKTIIGTAIGASAALASLGVATNLSSQNNEDISIDKGIENTIDTPIDKGIKLEDSKEKGIVIKLEPKIEDNINIIDNVDSETDVVDNTVENIPKEITVESIEEENVIENIKLGSDIYLNDTILSYDCYNTSPRINTNDLNFNHFKLCYIAVLRGNKVIDVLDRTKIDYLKDKTFKELENNYETKLNEDIEIVINVDGTYDNIDDVNTQFIKNQGWINLKYLNEDNISMTPFEKGKSL